jgi:leucyl aminopeptidase
MNFELKPLDFRAATTHRADALVVLIPAHFKPGRDAISQSVAQAHKSGDLDSAAGKTLSLWRVAGVQAPRLVLASIGDGTAKQVRKAVTAAVNAVKGGPVKHLTICLPQADEQRLVAAAQAVSDASYVYTATKPSAKSHALQRVTFALPKAADVKAAREEFDHACAQVAGVAMAREWGNLPANHATPTHLAKAAQALTKHRRIRCEVMGPKEIAKLGMGSFAAVAQGSVEPARFIVLHYQGTLKSQAPVVLVGKGITFDTGGISLKPGPGMD